jgi:hypothetical protein
MSEDLLRRFCSFSLEDEGLFNKSSSKSFLFYYYYYLKRSPNFLSEDFKAGSFDWKGLCRGVNSSFGSLIAFKIFGDWMVFKIVSCSGKP